MLNTVHLTKRSSVVMTDNPEDSVMEDSDILDTRTVENVYNIKQSRNFDFSKRRVNSSGTTYFFPDITLETMDGEVTVENAHIENYSELTPNVDVTILKKKTDSSEGSIVVREEAYGIYQNEYTNDFGQTCYDTIVLLPSEKPDVDVVSASKLSRGMMGKFANDETRYYGNFERHSVSHKRSSNPKLELEPPVNPESNTFSVASEKGVYENVVNVRRRFFDSGRTFALKFEDESVEYVTEIYDIVNGGLYTICLQIEKDERHRTVTETVSLKRLIGIYKDTGFNNSEDYLYGVGYPEVASIYKTPGSVSYKMDNIQCIHIKRPDGEIVTSIPAYCTEGTSDIPNLTKLDESISTEICKERLLKLLELRVNGNLPVSDEPDSDFQKIVGGYPSLEKLLRNIDDRPSLYKNAEYLPKSIEKSEINSIAPERKNNKSVFSH